MPNVCFTSILHVRQKSLLHALPNQAVLYVFQRSS